MRDPKRIDETLAELRKLWMEVPDWRLGQLIVNCANPAHPCPQVFNMEDEEMLNAIRDMRNRLDGDPKS